MKKIGKILGFSFLGILIVGTFVFLWSKSKPKKVEYEDVSFEVRDIEKVTVINGTIVPRDEVDLKPQISGIITEIYKEPGDIVRTGDVIARVQVVPDIAQLNNAEAQLKRAEINLSQAASDFERTQKLYQSGVVSKEVFENSNTAYLNAKEDVANAKENIQIIKEGISNSMAQYSNTQIRATISGMILDIPVKVGNSVIQSNTFNDGTTIATIANMTDLIFNGKVDEVEVGRITVGNDVKLFVGAMQNTTMHATLEYIAPKGAVVNGATLFEIKAAIKVDNVDSMGFIRSGYSANGEIVTQRKPGVIALPESTIEFAQDSTFVYFHNPAGKKDDQYQKTPITLGLSDGLYVEITSPVDTARKVRGKVKTNEMQLIINN